MHMQRIMFSSVAHLALPYFFTLCHKQHNCVEEVPEHKFVCFDLLHTIQHNSHSKNNSARCYHNCMYVGLHVKWQIEFSGQTN